MPLFEDDTLEGAIRKATAGLRPNHSSMLRTGAVVRTKSSHIETFDNRPMGSVLPGTGRGNFLTRDEALQSIEQNLRSLAEQYYNDRVAALRRGSDNPRDNIPELATLIIYYLPNPQDPLNVLYRYLNFHVGNLNLTTGNGNFEIPPHENMTDLVHAHWSNNSPLGEDVGVRNDLQTRTRGRRLPNGEPYQMEFHVYGLGGGLHDY